MSTLGTEASMFWLFSVGVAVAYGVQNILIVPFAQSRDPFLITALRNLSFLVTFLPVVILFSGIAALQQVLVEHAVPLCIGATFGCFAMWCRNVGLRSSPVGVLTAIIVTSQTVGMVAFEAIWRNRMLTAADAILGILIILGSLTCTWYAKRQKESPCLQPNWKGALLGVGCGLSTVVAVIPLVAVCQQADAIAAGFVWEIFIGLWASLSLRSCGLATQNGGKRVVESPRTSLDLLGQVFPQYSRPSGWRLQVSEDR